MAQRKPATKSTVHRRPERVDGGVVIAYIHPGEVSGYFLESMLTTVLSDVARGPGRRIVNIMQEWSSANVSSSRNTVTQRFLDSPAGDWLLWVDADMQWDPADFDRLIDTAHPTERPIVGGLCFGMAGGRLWPTIYQWVDLPEGRSTVRVGMYETNSLIQVAATGAAFILIHRTVLEAVRDRAFNVTFPWFQETELRGKPVGEDLTFCIRAGLLGIPVYVDTGVRIGHHKSQLLTEDVFAAQPEEG